MMSCTGLTFILGCRTTGSASSTASSSRGACNLGNPIRVITRIPDPPRRRNLGLHTAIGDICPKCDQSHRSELAREGQWLREAGRVFLCRPGEMSHMSDLAPIAEDVALDPLVSH